MKLHTVYASDATWIKYKKGPIKGCSLLVNKENQVITKYNPPVADVPAMLITLKKPILEDFIKDCHEFFKAIFAIEKLVDDMEAKRAKEENGQN